MMFLPLQGTFFLMRGVNRGFLSSGFWTASAGLSCILASPAASLDVPSSWDWSTWVAAWCVASSRGSEAVAGAPAEPWLAVMATVLPACRARGTRGFNVSTLDRPRRRREGGVEDGLSRPAALGVRRSLSSRQPTSEPLSEEWSVSLPSLNQCLGSALTMPVV